MRDISKQDVFTKYSTTDFRFAEARRLLADDPNFTHAYFKGDKGYASVGGIRIGNKLYYAISLCSPSDNFSRVDGRLMVNYHFCDEATGSKRGMIELDDEQVKERAGVVLLRALKRFVERGRHVPYWAKHTEFDFLKKD
jgi:hypothetical protein